MVKEITKKCTYVFHDHGEGKRHTNIRKGSHIYRKHKIHNLDYIVIEYVKTPLSLATVLSKG